MAKKVVSLGKTALFYGYVIAFQARADMGIQDCDVNPGYSLCNKGANYIRQNRQKLVDRYSHQAKSIAGALGKDKEVLFVMEPDVSGFGKFDKNLANFCYKSFIEFNNLLAI
jgi:hypothetical protein